jgi:hypothetical protein
VDEANQNVHSADAAIKSTERRCHPLKLGYLFFKPKRRWMQRGRQGFEGNQRCIGKEGAV